jgi:hypothetical protein
VFPNHGFQVTCFFELDVSQKLVSSVTSFLFPLTSVHLATLPILLTSTLKMEAVSASETLASAYQTLESTSIHSKSLCPICMMRALKQDHLRYSHVKRWVRPFCHEYQTHVDSTYLSGHVVA